MFVCFQISVELNFLCCPCRGGQPSMQNGLKSAPVSASDMWLSLTRVLFCSQWLPKLSTPGFVMINCSKPGVEKKWYGRTPCMHIIWKHCVVVQTVSNQISITRQWVWTGKNTESTECQFKICRYPALNMAAGLRDAFPGGCLVSEHYSVLCIFFLSPEKHLFLSEHAIGWMRSRSLVRAYSRDLAWVKVVSRAVLWRWEGRWFTL